MKTIFKLSGALVLAFLIAKAVVLLRSQGVFNARRIELAQLPLSDLQGNPINWQTYTDKPILVNFWATWCGPCRAEKPHLARAQQLLAPEGWAFVSISDEDLPLLQQFAQQYPIEGVELWHLGKARQLAQIFEVPQTYIISRDGAVVYRHTGARAWDSPEVLAELRKLVAP